MLASTSIHLSVLRTQSMEICFKTDKHVIAPKQKNTKTKRNENCFFTLYHEFLLTLRRTYVPSVCSC